MIEPSGFWQRVLRSRSALMLIAANLIPFFGVLFGGWSAFDVVFLFWLENAIIGLFNICKMWTAGAIGRPDFASPEQKQSSSKPDAANVPTSETPRALRIGGMLCLSAFFTFHYGGFMFVHGVFIVALLKRPWGQMPVPDDSPFDLLKHVKEAISGDLLWPFLALFASHGFSFLYNFVGRKEYERVNVGALMGAPYGRVVVLHLAILFGGMLSLFLPPFMVGLLVILKIGLDLRFHLKEHETGVVRLLPHRGKESDSSTGT